MYILLDYLYVLKESDRDRKKGENYCFGALSMFRKFLTVEMQLVCLLFLSFFLVEISICDERL